MDEMNGVKERGRSNFYLLTLDEKGAPCLDGKKIAGVRSYTIDADDFLIATLTVSLYVRLNPKVGFYGGGDDVGGNGRQG